MKFWRSLLVGLVLGALPGAIIAGIALDHNPQGEFADTVTGAYTFDLYMLFGASTLLAAIPITVLLTLIGILRRTPD